MYVVKQQTERYETVETLAEGAMGTVRLARDQLLGRLVAIKTVRLDTVTDPKEQARLRESLLHEAEMTQFLSHPNIVTIHEVLDDGEGETPSLVMEYVPGSTLAELLRGESPLPLDLALSIVAQIASALDHAHTMGVIHGDIKAANILDRRGRGDDQASRLRESRKCCKVIPAATIDSTELRDMSRLSCSWGRRRTLDRTCTRWACCCLRC